MTAALDPEHALAFLALLSTDIRRGAVVDTGGQALAGDAELGAAIVQIEPRGDDIVRRETPAGTLFATSSGDATVAIEVGPHALAGLVEHDLRRVARELG